MKKFFKEHLWFVVGIFLIWVAPLIVLVCTTYNKVETIKYLDLVGIVGCVLFIIAYYKKLKGVIRDKMLEKNIKNEPIWIYRIFQYINFGLGFVIFLLLYDFCKSYIDEVKNFLLVFFMLGTFGYVCLVIDGIGGGNSNEE